MKKMTKKSSLGTRAGLILWIILVACLAWVFVKRDAEKVNQKIERGIQPPGVVVEDSFGVIQNR